MDISLRIGALLGFMGLKWQDESSQIWRQLVSETSELVLIAKHHLLFSSQHATMMDTMGSPHTTAVYIIALKDLRYPILYSMNGHVGLFSAASTSSYYFYTQKHTF